MPARATPDHVDVFVEIPRGSRAKYELDKKSGHIRLDRVLHSSVHYPADYGFVMDTLGNDGDPLDAVVIVEEPTFPGCVVPARPIGTLFMRDSKGEDEKILAVPVGDPRFDEIRTLRISRRTGRRRSRRSSRPTSTSRRTTPRCGAGTTRRPRGA
jgi:inorganic pyrophosphatase